MLRVIEDAILTDIADAIREKTDTAETMQDYEIAEKIRSISGWGGYFFEPSESDVNFYDYEGTRLYAYTADEFAALSSLPEFPSRPGLICQGWNWTLEDMQAYAAKYGMCDAGANYTTDDGKTRLYMNIADVSKKCDVAFHMTVNEGVTVDWGDGYSQVCTGTLSSGLYKFSGNRSYEEPGEYVVTLEIADGCEVYLGIGSNTNGLGNSFQLIAVETGKGLVGLNNGVFGSTGALERVSLSRAVRELRQVIAFRGTVARALVVPPGCAYNALGVYMQFIPSHFRILLPNGATAIPGQAFSRNNAEKILIPSTVNSLGGQAFAACAYLRKVVIPEGVTEIPADVFFSCYALTSINSMPNLISIGDNAFKNCAQLTSFTLAGSLVSIGTSAFANCLSLSSMKFPAALATIGANAFMCCGATTYDFTACTAIPTLGADAFYGHPASFSIKVPAALLDAWKAAENWNSYADYIVGV